MIIAIYEGLSQALAGENSLPVLTQVLKCLACLIQATPFHKWRNGFVSNFVKYVRRLVYHKDPTIQVAALMVMEFLISVKEKTKEIAQCVGIPEEGFNIPHVNPSYLQLMKLSNLQMKKKLLIRTTKKKPRVTSLNAIVKIKT